MKKIVIANWKNHPDSLVEAKKIFQGIERQTRGVRRTKIVVCPPLLYLEELARSYRGSRISFGSQDISSEETGSWTGETSGTMLKRSGASFVIVGHSEKRLLGDTNEIVSKKIQETLRGGLVPILCIGEKERDEEAHYLQFIDEEITNSLRGILKDEVKKIFIAYEPIFAIGKSAKDALASKDLHHMGLFIRKVLVRIYGRGIGMTLPILYGGSVESTNARALLTGGISGFLVGHASLVPKGFASIVKSVENYR